MQFQFQNNDFQPYQNTNVQQSDVAAYTITGVSSEYIRDIMNSGINIAPLPSSPCAQVWISGQVSPQASVSGQAFSQEGYISPIWDIYPPLNQPRKRELVSCCSGLC